MRLIDADALYIPPEEMNAKMAVACAPTIDAVPVVRCRDCKYFEGERTYCGYDRFTPNDQCFCFCGEVGKKEEDDEAD